MTAGINLSVGRALQEQPGTAAQVASHFLAAGPQARRSAHRLLDPRGAGGDSAPRTRGRLRALPSGAAPHRLRGRPHTEDRVEILLELAAAHERAGSTDLAAAAVLRGGRRRPAHRRSGGPGAGGAGTADTRGAGRGRRTPTTIELLTQASRRLELSGGPLALRVPGTRGPGPRAAARIIQGAVRPGRPAGLRRGPDGSSGRRVGDHRERRHALAVAQARPARLDVVAGDRRAAAARSSPAMLDAATGVR